MPQRKAAKKDLRQNLKKRTQNLKVKSQIKKTLKDFKKAIKDKDLNSTKKALSLAYKVLDKAVSKKVIHAKKAARQKSRLTKLLKKTST